RLLELYLLSVVVWVLENVSVNECRPILFSIPNPISGSESFLKPSRCMNVESKTGVTIPCLKPTRGVNSNIRETDGRTRPSIPNPNEPVCCPSLTASARGWGGKKSLDRGLNRPCPLELI